MIAVWVVIHAAATLMMAGLIWFVQLVHYPMLGRYERFTDAHREHMRRTTWVVAPLMTAEALSAVMLAVLCWSGPGRGVTLAGLGLLAMVWGSTVFVQVPCHARLRHGNDEATLRRLVRTNWVRTAGWSARSVVAVLLWRGTYI